MGYVRGHFRRTGSGFTYVRPSFQRSSGSGAVGMMLLVMAGAGVWVIAAIVRLLVALWFVLVGGMVIGGVVASGIALSRWFRERRVEAYLRVARQAVEAFEDRFDELDRLAGRIPRDDQRRMLGEEDIYRSFVAQVLADGWVSDEEWAKLQRVHAIFAFDAQQALAIREQAFDGFMAWVGLDLTEAQEAAVRTVAARLELPQPRTEAQLATVSERRRERERQAMLVAEREAQQAAIAAVRQHEAELEAERQRQARLAAQRQREAALEAKRARLEAQRLAACAVFDRDRREPAMVRAKLRRGESCWWSGQAHLRDRKNTRVGDLLITNKRIVFLSDTVVNVALDKILDVAADFDSGILRLVKDGRKTPYEFLLEQPLVALAHIERSLAEASGTFQPEGDLASGTPPLAGSAQPQADRDSQQHVYH